ncbi:MAG: alpha/beta hydrolase [Bacteroidota bacterium]
MRDRLLRACARLAFALLLALPAAAQAQPADAPAQPAADWLTPSDAVPDARFGAAVVLLPDGRLVIGAPGATGERLGTGVAYVFTYDRDRLTWVETAKLVAPGGLPGDGFGARADARGDTLLLSAPGAQTHYAYIAEGNTWRFVGQIDGVLQTGSSADLSFSDLEARVYSVRYLANQDAPSQPEVQVSISVATGSASTDGLRREYQAALLTDPDLRASEIYSTAQAFDGRFLALGTPDAEGGGAVYVWSLEGQWLSEDLAPTLPGFGAKASPEDYVEVEVFYGTDRARTGKRNPRRFYGGRRGDELQMGTATVTIPKTHEPGEMESPSWLRLQFRADPAKHIILQDVSPLDTDEAVAAMQAALDSTSSRAVLLYVHGFNVSFEDAARRTAQMAYDLGYDGVPAFYSWPSDASLLRYLADENDVMWSVFHLKAFLREIALRTGADDVHIVAHSMGNRAVTQALREFACEFKAPQFNQVILAAPDVDAEVFRRDIAPAITGAAEQITLYASADDTALRLSQTLHGAPRAGNTLVTAPGITTIDASGLDPSLLGHSYYADLKQLIDDIGALVKQGLAPAARALFQKGDSVWELEKK